MSNKPCLKLCYLFLIPICVNVVSCTDDQPLWYSYQFGTGHENREELVIKNVVSDETFNLGKNVIRWKSISMGTTAYAVGLMTQGFIVITAKLHTDKNKFIATSQKVTDMEMPVTDLELFAHWNEESVKQEVVLVVSAYGATRALFFYTIKKQSSELLWAWYVDMKVSYMQYFQLEDNKHMLLLLHNDETDIDAYLYEFTLTHPLQRNFWLVQTFPLTVAANSSAINTFGSDIYLSIPQTDLNVVLIYKFVRNRFQLYQNITSQSVSKITSFKIGFKSFLAIGGAAAGIYRFTKKGIVLEEVDGLNLDNIDFWFPVPIKTYYRDEMALILQRSLSHGTHKSFSLEVVFYDGRKFVVHEEFFCSFFGEIENGASCMVDEEGDIGLLGAAVLSLKNTLGILVPRNGTTGLFMIHTEMKKLKSPVELEVEKLMETRRELQKMIDEQQDRIRNVQERLNNSLKVNESNTITDPWKINTLSAPVVRQNLEIPVPVENMKMEEIEIQDLKDQAAEIRQAIDDARRSLLNAVLLDQPEHHFDELVVDGEVQVPRESKFKSVITEKFNGEPVRESFNDLVRKNQVNPIPSHKTFTDIEVEDIHFDFLNGVDVRNKIINTGAPIVIASNVIFDQPVKVIGKVTTKGHVNDVDLSSEVVEMNKIYDGPLTFEQIQVDTAQINNLPVQIDTRIGKNVFDLNEVDELELDILSFPGNITVENLNGENFNDFLKSLCFTNIKTHIPGETFIAGDLNAENADVVTLNGLKFPEEYVLKNAKFTQISGKKMFEGKLFAKEVVVRETINGINTDDVITLSTNQTLTGTFVFNDLGVTQSLNVQGSMTGPYMDNFLANPLLTQTNEVKAKVNFKHLEVDGTVIVSEKLNQADFGEMLSDVLYTDEEEATISSIKSFPLGFTVINGINTDSEAVNSIPISSFVTKNTEQIIAFKTLNGPVSFENLFLLGLYGNVNITELEQETVKLSGEQFISSTLIFSTDDGDLIDFSAVDMRITNTLNNLTSNDYFYTTSDSRSLNNYLNFEELRAEKLFVEGDVSGELKDFSVKDFDDRRLSYTKDQVVMAAYNVLKLESANLDAEFVNAELFRKFVDFQHYAERVAEMLLEGKLKITNLRINGSVFVESVNGFVMEEVLQKWMWTDRTNNFDSMTFLKGVTVENLFLKNFNGVDFKLFMDNVIFNNEKDLIIDGYKVFVEGFHVNKMLNSERINEVHVDHILMKTGSQELKGPLNIFGRVLVKTDCELHGNLNNISVDYLTRTFQFVDDTYTVNEDLVMNRLAYVNSFEVEGYVNGENFEEFLSNMVYRNKPNKIFGKTSFEKPVVVHRNMMVTETLNSVDFSEFVEDMVFITKDDLIEGPVIFTQPVYIENDLVVDSDLSTKVLAGRQLETWNNRAVFINQGQIPGNVIFETVTIQENVYLDFLNDIDLNLIIPLHTEQYIDKTMEIYELTLFNNVRVEGFLNGFKAFEEFRKTLFDTGDIQTVTQSITFLGNFTVGKDIQISGFVNGKNLSKVVTTNSIQTLRASYNFTDADLQGDLNFTGLANGMDPTEWQNKSVRIHSKQPQTIDDGWVVKGNTTFKENVEGGGLVGGINLQQLEMDVKDKQVFRRMIENRLLMNYDLMCQDVNTLLEKAQNQIYLFKHLEKIQTLKFEHNIENVHHFKYKNDNYILLTEDGSCMSHLLYWSEPFFKRIESYETGSISQLISVYDGDLLFLVSRTKKTTPNCSVQGTNVWKFEPDQLMNLYKLEDQELVQESLVPGTFYGLTENNVVEFRLVTVVETNVKRFRKWKLNTTNLAFVPRGLGTGLALSNGKMIFRLLREDPVIEDDFGYETDAYIIGKVVQEVNTFLPGRSGDDVLVSNVGVEGNRRTLVGVASHEETSVKGRLDFIKIYENILTGKVFHKVSTYKPSSLISIEFSSSGETLLMFLEDGKTLQVYEYRGIEGFKHRTSAELEGSKLIAISLTSESNRMEKKIVGVVNNNEITLIEAVMTGNQLVMEKQSCEL